MARTQKESYTPQYNAPDFLAWNVIDKGERSYWNKVGAAWRHKDDKGYTLQLETVPSNGPIVIRQTLEGPDHQNEKENGRA